MPQSLAIREKMCSYRLRFLNYVGKLKYSSISIWTRHRSIPRSRTDRRRNGGRVCYTDKAFQAVHTYIIYSAASALSVINQVCTHNSAPPLHLRSPRNSVVIRQGVKIRRYLGIGLYIIQIGNYRTKQYFHKRLECSCI